MQVAAPSPLSPPMAGPQPPPQVPAQFRTIAIRNRMGGPTTFWDEPSQTKIIWEGVGNMAGLDVQYAPEGIVYHPSFRRMITLGVFEVLDQAAADAVAAMGAGATSSSMAHDAAAAAAIDNQQVNEIITVACIGPGPRPGAPCPTPGMMRQSEVNTRPPLCEQHQPLAAGFVPVESPGPDGIGRITWVYAQMGLTQTEATQAQDPTAGIPAGYAQPMPAPAG